jgi:hypothetical protein
LSTIPDAYLRIIEPIIRNARELLEKGEHLNATAYVGNFASGTITPVVLRVDSEMGKEDSARLIKLAADFNDADFIFVLMEAWSLRKDKLSKVEKIYERYGSIAASPYAVDIMAASLETIHGVWMAEIPIKPKGVSKKKRTFGVPEFKHFTEMKGRFVHLLPERDGERDTGVLH